MRFLAVGETLWFLDIGCFKSLLDWGTQYFLRMHFIFCYTCYKMMKFAEKYGCNQGLSNIRKMLEVCSTSATITLTLENTAWELLVCPSLHVLQLINYFSKMCWWEFKTLDLKDMLTLLQADALGVDVDALHRRCFLSCRYTQRASHQQRLMSFTTCSVRVRQRQLLSSLGNW